METGSEPLRFMPRVLGMGERAALLVSLAVVMAIAIGETTLLGFLVYKTATEPSPLTLAPPVAPSCAASKAGR
jgi:hypothetical protein